MLSVVPDSGLAPPCAGARPGNNSEPAAAPPARNNCRRRSRRSKIIIFLASPAFPSILAEREMPGKSPAPAIGERNKWRGLGRSGSDRHRKLARIGRAIARALAVRGAIYLPCIEAVSSPQPNTPVFNHLCTWLLTLWDSFF